MCDISKWKTLKYSLGMLGASLHPYKEGSCGTTLEDKICANFYVRSIKSDKAYIPFFSIIILQSLSVGLTDKVNKQGNKVNCEEDYKQG